MNQEDIRSGLDESLSGLYLTDARKQTLCDEIAGGKKMKKKAAVSLTLVFAMVLLTVSAVAAGVLVWQNVSDPVAQIEKASGEYENWTDEDKVELVRILAENEVIELTEDEKTVLDESVSMEERGKMADQIFLNWYGGDAGNVSLAGILEAIHGDMASWSPEDLVWYNEMLARNGLKTDETNYTLSEEGEITEEEAIAAARKLIVETYGIDDAVLDTAKNVSRVMEAEKPYYANGNQERRVWSIIFQETSEGTFHADILANGQPYGSHGNWEGSPYVLVPGDGDLSEEAAVSAAKEALGKAADGAEVKAYLYLCDLAQEEGSPIELGDRLWNVTFTRDGATVGIAIVKQDGTVITDPE